MHPSWALRRVSRAQRRPSWALPIPLENCTSLEHSSSLSNTSQTLLNTAQPSWALRSLPLAYYRWRWVSMVDHKEENPHQVTPQVVPDSDSNCLLVNVGPQGRPRGWFDAMCLQTSPPPRGRCVVTCATWINVSFSFEVNLSVRIFIFFLCVCVCTRKKKIVERGKYIKCEVWKICETPWDYLTQFSDRWEFLRLSRIVGWRAYSYQWVVDLLE